MAELIVRPEASADIADVYSYSIEQFGLATGEAYHDGLQAAVERLAEHPRYRGQSTPDFARRSGS
jgi:plasmid stabilization system protein ParE